MLKAKRKSNYNITETGKYEKKNINETRTEKNNPRKRMN